MNIRQFRIAVGMVFAKRARAAVLVPTADPLQIAMKLMETPTVPSVAPTAVRYTA